MHVNIYKGQDIAETFRRKALRHAPEGTSAEVKVAMTDTANAVHADVEYVNQTVERDGTLYVTWRPLGAQVPTVAFVVDADGQAYALTLDIPPLPTDGLIR